MELLKKPAVVEVLTVLAVIVVVAVISRDVETTAWFSGVFAVSSAVSYALRSLRRRRAASPVG